MENKEVMKNGTTNNVFITGVLVDKDFQYKDVDVKDENGNVIGKEKAISGKLILRTDDGSENEVDFYSKRLKKDGNENSIFKGLETVMNEYKTLKQFPNEADIVKIGAGQFNVQDYKGKDGEVKTYNGVKANFANRLTLQEIETTPKETKFEIEGIVEKVSEEIYKNEPTGNVKIVVNVLGYQATIIPVTIVVPKPIVEPFMGAGFFEGGYAKFTGKLVNTKETVEVVEKMAFGADNVKIVTTTVSRKEVTGGNPMGMPTEHSIDEQVYEQAKSKRKMKLDAIKNETKADNSSQTPPVNNPFASGGSSTTSNPFNPFTNM